MISILDNVVKEIRQYKNAQVYNEHHEMIYIMKKYIEIEFFNGKIIKLYSDGKADISNCEYLIIKDKGKLIKTLFKNELA